MSTLLGGDTYTVGQTTRTYASRNVTDNGGTGTVSSGTLSAGSFTSGNATISNYAFKIGRARGGKASTTAPLTVSLTGTVQKTYDGGANATLASGNYTMSTLLGGDTFTVGQTTGTYASRNVTDNGGTGTVSSGTLSAGSFTSGNATISNYAFNTVASGSVGSITTAPLTVSLTGTVQKTYDGGANATLASGNYTMSTLLGGDTFTVGQTTAADRRGDDTGNGGTGTVSSGTLSAGSFTSGNATISNYAFNTVASGSVGSITTARPAERRAGTVQKTYDGGANATLASGNYTMSTLLGGDTFTVGQTTGTYASRNVTDNGGTGTVSSGTLSAGSFTSGNATISNYAFNTVASGSVGSITTARPAERRAGTVQKTYDGGANATLASGNYKMSTLLCRDTFTVGQTTGTYASRNVTQNTGTGTVSSGTLSAGSFTIGNATISNYAFNTVASGSVGSITTAPLTVSLTGTVQKTYDGGATPPPAALNYTMSTLLGGDTFTVGQTTGTYASRNVTDNGGTGTVSSGTLSAGSFTSGNATISNYAFNTVASGSVGSITTAPLTVSLTGTVQKTYDGGANATLASG